MHPAHFASCRRQIRRSSEALVHVDERFGAFRRPCNLLVRSIPTALRMYFFTKLRLHTCIFFVKMIKYSYNKPCSFLSHEYTCTHKEDLMKIYLKIPHKQTAPSPLRADFYVKGRMSVITLGRTAGRGRTAGPGRTAERGRTARAVKK